MPCNKDILHVIPAKRNAEMIANGYDTIGVISLPKKCKQPKLERTLHHLPRWILSDAKHRSETKCGSVGCSTLDQSMKNTLSFQW